MSRGIDEQDDGGAPAAPADKTSRQRRRTSMRRHSAEHRSSHYDPSGDFDTPHSYRSGQYHSRSPAHPRSRSSVVVPPTAGGFSSAKGRSRSAADRGRVADDDPVALEPGERKRGKRPVVVNLSCCKYPLLREVASQQGWVEDSEETTGRFNLWWTDTSVSYQRVMRLRNWQRINHFPCMHLICRKNALSGTLGRIRKYRRERGIPKDASNFFPRTWSLKSERNLIRTQTVSGRTYIVKPSAGCQGKGIFLTPHPWRDTKELEDAVVQEYVDQPLLIEDKKFDLRVYVLVTSVRHMSVQVFNEGLVRLCTEDYVAPSEENIDRTCMHLTNYAINRQSENFVFNTDADQCDTGNKRDFRFLNRWLRENGHDADLLWSRIDEVIVKTLLAAQPQLRHEYNSCFPHGNDGFTCFEILGFDLLIDSSLRPWLLEVNHSPSFRTDTPMDHRVKSSLITQTVSILNLRGDDSRFDARRLHDDFVIRMAQQARALGDAPEPPVTVVREPYGRLGVDLGKGRASWGFVTGVGSGGCALAAGVGVGWRLVAVNGEPLLNEDQFRAALECADLAGEVVKVTFERPVKESKVDPVEAAIQERLRARLADEDRRAAAVHGVMGFRRAYPAPDPDRHRMFQDFVDLAHGAAHSAGHVAAAPADRYSPVTPDDTPASPLQEAPTAPVRSRSKPLPQPRPRPVPRESRQESRDRKAVVEPAPEAQERPAPAPPLPDEGSGRTITVFLRCTEKLGLTVTGGEGADWRVVTSVTPDGVADRAGVRVGMMVVKAAGGPVNSTDAFRGAVAQVRAIRSAEVPFVFGDGAAVAAASAPTTTHGGGVKGTPLSSFRTNRLEVHGGELVAAADPGPMPYVLRPTPPPVLRPSVGRD
eukprot:Hpha_TRINITY_DN14918_c4_g2::TRINITY_DN14918_c4_g2_i1::g.142982::m.142982/K16582/TTLL6_13; tubulin polyglutamylase TTLL6/13